MSVQLITGPMFSGKSTELQRRLRRHAARFPVGARPAVLVVPRCDTRFAVDHSVTHDGAVAAADLTPDDADLLSCLGNPLVRDASMVCIDEGQFFAHLAPVCERLAAAGKQVVVAALSSDFLRRPFRSVAELLAVADDVTRLSAVCQDCGGDAAFTARTGSVRDVVLVGGRDTYRAVCRRCHPARAPCPVVVAIEGPPGCGKTSLLRLVERDARFAGLAAVVPEPVEAWPPGLLDAYYTDMPRMAALFQLEALATRRRRVGAAVGAVPVLIVERSWEADRRCFAEFQADTGRMPPLDAAVYRDVSQALLEGLPALSGVFYLRSTPEACCSRVAIRQRDGEARIDLPYLAGLAERHERWLLGPEAPAVVVVGDGNRDRDPTDAAAAEPLLLGLLGLCRRLAGPAGQEPNPATPPA